MGVTEPDWEGIILDREAVWDLDGTRADEAAEREVPGAGWER